MNKPALANPTGSNLTFSIIIGAYNAEQSLDACLASLFAQRFDATRYEVIVVDDGSQDQTALVALRHPAARLVTLSENQGPAAARNAGLAVATGAVAVSFDADCTADPGWLAGLEQAYRDNPAASGVAGWLTNGTDTTLLDQYLNLTGYGNPSRLLNGREGGPLGRLKAYLQNSFLFHAPSGYYEVHHAYGANASFRTGLLRAVGGWDPQLRAAEDTDLAERVRRRYPNRPIIGTPHARLTHHHDMTIASFLARAVRRGPAVLAYYRHNHILPPIFPSPLAVLSLATLAWLARLPWLLPLVPLACYPWYPLRFAVTGRPRYLAFAYLEFINELLTIIGLIYGALKLNRLVRKVFSHG